MVSSAMLSLSPLLSLLLGATPATPAADPVDGMMSRPYGNVMGDGLSLQNMPPPVGGAVCAPGETLPGIDVSYYQGDIDWPAVAASGVAFSIVRVSHSLQFFDPQFQANLDGSRAAGIHTGVYQYFEPDEDPIAQADLLLDAMGPLLPGDLPPMIDVESAAGQSPAAIASAVQAWVDHVEAELGVKPLLYTGFYFWQDNVGSAEFGEYPLVLPWYGVACPGGVPAGWDMWTIHQYCDCGNVPGIAGAVDVDTFNGSLADLEALASPGECGDAACTGTETPYTCPADCAPCGVIAADGGTIDNGDACYRLYGDDVYWREEPQGEGGTLLWTHATDFDTASNYAVWQLHFEETGLYDLEIRITQPFGESQVARYVVRHAGGETPVVLDQSSLDGWVSLGEYSFDAAADHTLRLDDNTGEASADEVMIVYDAVRATRLDGQEATTGEPGGDDTGATSDGSASADGGTEGGTSGPDGAGTTGVDTDGAGQRGDDDSGCGCRSTGEGGRFAGLAGLLLLGLRRRRRAAQSTRQM
jgi:MYXO-CTERM domain-containing protein